jgi:hypothetical protein
MAFDRNEPSRPSSAGKHNDVTGSCFVDQRKTGARSWVLPLQAYGAPPRLLAWDRGRGGGSPVAMARQKASRYPPPSCCHRIEPVAGSTPGSQGFPCFRDVAAVANRGQARTAWRNPKHAAQWSGPPLAKHYAYPLAWGRWTCRIDRGWRTVLSALKPIGPRQTRIGEPGAPSVSRRCSTIATAKGLRTGDNPRPLAAGTWDAPLAESPRRSSTVGGPMLPRLASDWRLHG